MMFTHPDAKPPSLNICNHRNSEAQTFNKDRRLSDQPAGQDTNLKRHLKKTKQNFSEAKQKDIKKYMVPVQKVTKLISPVPDEKLLKTSGDCSGTETLILQESTSSLNSSGVFKVTAKSTIDISDKSSYSSLLYTNLLMKDLESVTSKNHIRNTPDINTTKRSGSQLPNSNLAKKAKSDDDLKMNDKEENRTCLGDGNPVVYHCKHCSYSNNDIKHTQSHYLFEHPHVQLNLVYITDPTDLSATFRCLECPVEVSNEDDLKRHYNKTHPEAPEVSKVRLHELLFKCFVCTLVTDKCSILREHYKEKHPDYNLDNPLIFFRYSVPLQVKAEKDEQSVRTPEEVSPKKTQFTEFLDASLPSNPNDTKANSFFYQCSKCSFRHKSAVALHVHYQKKHPDEAITINKIKQSGIAKPDTPDLSDSRAKETENLTPRESGCDSSTKKTESASQTRQRVLMSLMKLKGTLVACKRPESSTSADAKSEDKREKQKNRDEYKLAEMKDSFSHSPGEIFSCQVCSFSTSNVEDVVTHYNTEHNMMGRTSVEEVLCYNAKKKSKDEASAECETSPTVTSENQEAFSLYKSPEKLFYCQNCNFANITLKGIANHQSVAHKNIKSSHVSIIKHTAKIRDSIKNLKIQTKDSPLPSYLPLPLLHLGDENKAFCQVCNFRSDSTSNVLRHCYTKHPNFILKLKDVTEYTATVLQQQATNMENSAVEKKSELLQKDVTPRQCAEVQEKNFHCYRCHRRFQGLPRLRKHMWNVHHCNRPNIQLLSSSFRKGLVEPGYYCNICGFSHTTPEVVLEHFKENHYKVAMTLESVTTKLWVGPQLLPKIKKKRMRKTVTVVDDHETPSSETRSPESGSYSCGYCSFRGDSLSSVTHHLCTDCPRGKQENTQNVPLSKKTTTDLPTSGENHDTTQLDYEFYQMPIEFESPTSPEEEIRKVKCLYCPAKFQSQHGLKTHCGLMHRDKAVRNQIDVHTCLYCTYVNTTYQGVLTHCQMKHPLSEAKSKIIHLEDVHFRCGEGDGKIFRGHMCKKCCQIFESQEKLIKHRRFECMRLQKGTTLSNASLLSKKKQSRFRCQHCDTNFGSKLLLDSHLHTEHQEELYFCALCTCSYTNKKKLENHYIRSHGRKALVKHFKTLNQLDTRSAPASAALPSSQPPAQPHTLSAVADDSSALVYKCPRCPYVNTSYHGTLTHCQMRHPFHAVRVENLIPTQVNKKNIFKHDKPCPSIVRGYMCFTCPQIFPSNILLKKHLYHSKHKKPKLSNLTQGQDSSHGSASKPNVAEESVQNQPATSEKGPNKEKHFKCQLCSYKGIQRKYLQTHYKKLHKLNTASAYKLMGKYNMRERNYETLGVVGGGPFKCTVCPNIAFDFPLFLIQHYSTVHQVDAMTDFRISSHMTKRNTGVYKCVHCRKRVNGIKNLSAHLDRHRDWKMKKLLGVNETSPPQATSREVSSENDSSVCEPVTPTKDTTLETSPKRRSSDPPNQTLLPPPDPQQLGPDIQQTQLEPEPELEASSEKFPCKQCQRTFMSLRGLRSHQNSHAAFAAIKKMDNVFVLNHRLNEYLIHKPGQLRPFVCSICTFRTIDKGLLMRHLVKKHQDVISEASAPLNPDDNEETANKDPSLSVEHDNEPEIVEDVKVNKSMYMEPADVQRQLDYFSSMLQRNQTSPSINTNSSFLYCEFCDFNTGHLSSMRRHYLARHGRKVYRCKDCDFFTGLRKTLDQHVENGHSTALSKSIQKKDLCCPFCLYENNNKNHMIDHILLHRDERVVPIEVRRSKLSRYLEGVVFRCHKCTFSCGSSDSLRVHMKKHHEVKPYRCRLCFFDSALLSQLEEHLSQKHQVERNHELVGQVILDKLDLEREEEEEPPLIDLKGDAMLTALEYKPVAKKSRFADQSEHETHQEGDRRICDQTEQLAENRKLQRKGLELCATNDEASDQNCAIKADQERTIKNEEIICSEDSSSVVLKRDSEKNCQPPNNVTVNTHLRPNSDNGQEEDCQLSREETADLYADMPVLENEFLKDAQVSKKNLKGEHDGGEGEVGVVNGKDEDMEEGGLSTDASTASEILHTPDTDDRRYVCTLCGRKLESSWELKCHTMRHRL